MKSEKSGEIDRGKLIRIALLKLGSGFVIIGLLLYLFAGTLEYWNASLFLLVAVIPMIFALIYLINKDLELLQKRLKAREPFSKQKKIVSLTAVLMSIAFIIPGIDYRYNWSNVPIRLVISGIIMFEFAYLLFAVVMMQNSYASRVIEIQKNQKVIDSGLYSIVRHPMYVASIFMDISIPLILGSYYALIPMILCCAAIIPRIKNEEEVLKKGLKGYGDYMKKVKYRLIPFIW